MSIEIRRAPDDAERWNDHLSRSRQASVFHRYGALGVIARHTDTDLHPLVGYEGQEVVGLLPAFERSVGPLTMAVSPPGGMEVFSLGPVLTGRDRLTQRELERRNRRFVAGCLDWLDAELDPEVVHVRSVERYTDLRPFQAREFDVTPYYTYVVDLDREEEDLLASFSGDARSNIRDAEGRDYSVELGGADACADVIRRVRDRLDDLGEGYPLTPAVAVDLYRRLPDGVVRPYVCTVDGERRGGIVALEGGDTVYRWQGGVRVDGDFPVNDVLDWHVMREAMDRGATRYDLVGANLSRTARYKSKFGPAPVPYYGAMKRPPGVDLLAKLRQRLPVVG